jgi:hypothetical protein
VAVTDKFRLRFVNPQERSNKVLPVIIAVAVVVVLLWIYLVVLRP